MASGTVPEPDLRLPILTSRLCLRLPIQSDIAGLADVFADKRITRWLAVDPMDEKEALEFSAEFIDDANRDLADTGCAPMVIDYRDGDSTGIVGYCGLRTLPGYDDRLELVYAAAPDLRRNGIISEAAQACLAWGFDNFVINRIVAMTRAGNSASLAVMTGLNMTYAGYTERYYGERLVQFMIERDTFAAQSTDFRKD